MALTNLSRSVSGYVAVITGAASGMGEATAKLFADQGCKVALLDRNAQDLNRVTEEITTAGCTAQAWPLDLRDKAATEEVIGEIARTFGGLDILVNNAGFGAGSAIDNEGFNDTWDLAMDVLLSAHTRTVRAALPFLRESANPRIVNISSTEGLGATKGNAPYAAAKHGVIGLTRSLAVDLGPEGITVNCICPGPISTPLTSAIPDEHKQIYARRRVAMKRYADPEEVAHGTLNFCLPAASFITGAVLPVDGGLTIKNA
ncbi:MAG: SDR family oxidoreductase [Pseudomonadota bacterium]